MTLRTGKLRSERTRQHAFTLIELILVLTLLAIAVSLVAPALSNFFRGRALDSEARRLLSLAHAGQARAISTGFPMLLWIDAKQHTYGLQEEGSKQNGNNNSDPDPYAEEFEASDLLQFDVAGATPISVNGRSVTAIRFLPDGSADENSPRSVRITAQNGDTLWLMQATNRLSYEIHVSDR
jgi:type II secretion system protein H